MKNRPAITWKDESISYATLARKTSSFYEAVKSVTPKRDLLKMAIFAPNSPEWVYTFMGIWKADAVLVPLDYLANEEEIKYILEESQPEVIFCSEDREQMLQNLGLEYGPIIQRIDKIKEEVKGPITLDFDKRLKSTNHQIALLIYTSGTTGGPKGVLLSYANIYANANAVCNKVPIFTRKRTVLALLPFHHIFPLLGSIVAPLYVKATIALVHSLDPLEIVKTMKKNRVGIIIGVPRFYARIFTGIKSKIDQSLIARLLFKIAAASPLKSVNKIIFGSVQRKFGGRIKYMVAGGAALDPKVGRGLDRLGFNILEGYGMTEAAPMITFPQPGKVKLGTVGQELFGVKVKIQDGEILAKGPNIMKGYYKKSDETTKTIVDGWLHTGDLGEMDSKGYLRIKGRCKELLVLPNGKNINPLEIEAKLNKLAQDLPISELAVGEKHDSLHLFIVTNDIKDRAILWKKIVSPYNDSVPSYKQIKSFQLQSSPLPKTRLEKIKRHELSSLIKKKVVRKIANSFEELRVIQNYLENEIGEEVDMNCSFFGEIALDSLGQVGLFSLIQELYNVTADNDIFNKLDTPFKLAHYLKENRKADAFNGEPFVIPKASPFGIFLKIFISLILQIYFRIKKIGKMPQGKQIFVCNHQSYIDSPLIATFFSNRSIKDTFFYAKAKHFKSRLLKFFASNHNIVIVDKDTNLNQSINQLSNLLERGKSLIIFPEGTRSFDGHLGEFKKTFAILAKKFSVPITPVAINGAYRALPRGSFFPRPRTKITVSFLEQVIPKINDSYQTLVDRSVESIRTALLP